MVFSSPMSSASPSRSHSDPPTSLSPSAVPKDRPPGSNIIWEHSGPKIPCVLGWLIETELLLGKSSVGEKPPLLSLSPRGQAPRVARRPRTPILIPVGPPAPSATSEQRQDKEPSQAGGCSPPSPRHAPRQPGDGRVSPCFEGSAAATPRLAAGGQS